jgi:hypothetical protein
MHRKRTPSTPNTPHPHRMLPRPPPPRIILPQPPFPSVTPPHTPPPLPAPRYMLVAQRNDTRAIRRLQMGGGPLAVMLELEGR